MRFFNKERYATFRQWEDTKKYFSWASSDLGAGALCEYLVFFYYTKGIDFMRTSAPTRMGGAEDMLIEHLENGSIDLFHEFHVNYDPDIVTNDIFRTTKEILIDAAEKFHIMHQLNPRPEQLLMYINDAGYVEFEPFFRIQIQPYQVRIQEMVPAHIPYALCIKWKNRNDYDFDACDNQSLQSLLFFLNEYYYSEHPGDIKSNIRSFGSKGRLGVYRDDSLLVLHQATTNPNYYKTDAAFYTTPAELLAITEQFHQYHQQNPMPDVIVIYRDTITNKVYMKPLYKENSTGFWQYAAALLKRFTSK